MNIQTPSITLPNVNSSEAVDLSCPGDLRPGYDDGIDRGPKSWSQAPVVRDDTKSQNTRSGDADRPLLEQLSRVALNDDSNVRMIVPASQFGFSNHGFDSDGGTHA